MIPMTRKEKFLHRGSAERVLHYRSIEYCVDPLLGFKNHNESPKLGGEVSTPWKYGKGPTL